MNDILPKVKMSDALASIEKVEFLVETGMTIDEAQTSVFGDIQDMPLDKAAGLTGAVDRYIAVWQAFEAKQQYIKEVADKVRKRKVSIDSAFDRFKSRIHYFLNKHPNIVFEGTEGRLDLKKKGGVPSMKLKFETFTVKDCVTANDVDKYDIPRECIRSEVVYRLDKNKLKEMLKRNVDSDGQYLTESGSYIEGSARFGTLERGQSVKVEL